MTTVKGSKPLPYTADQIMDLVDEMMRRVLYKDYSKETHAKLRKIAERYEYMNLHFNPAKSLITEDTKNGFPCCDPDRPGI